MQSGYAPRSTIGLHIFVFTTIVCLGINYLLCNTKSNVQHKLLMAAPPGPLRFAHICWWSRGDVLAHCMGILGITF